MGIPARISSVGEEPNSYNELVAELAQLLEANTAELRELNYRLAQREARIAELERLLSESRRSGLSR